MRGLFLRDNSCRCRCPCTCSCYSYTYIYLQGLYPISLLTILSFSLFVSLQLCALVACPSGRRRASWPPCSRAHRIADSNVHWPQSWTISHAYWRLCCVPIWRHASSQRRRSPPCDNVPENVHRTPCQHCW